MLSVFATLLLVAALHASFQLGASLLTLLSGHSIGAKRSHYRLLQLNAAYVAGVAFISTLLVATFGFFMQHPHSAHSTTVWLVIASLNVAVGLAVLLFYFRRAAGTELWLPRKMAAYLTGRVKKTKRSAEAFTLGMGSVVSELLFIIVPIATAALIITQFSPSLQAAALVSYIGVSILPLLVIILLVGAGHKISSIQKWREQNKRFLQYAAGCGLIVLGGYLFVVEVVDVAAKGLLP